MSEWCKINRLTLNVAKCNVVTYVRKQHPIMLDYLLNGSVFGRQDHAKDFEVIPIANSHLPPF